MIPVCDRKVTITRTIVPVDQDAYDDPSPANTVYEVATNVRAVISPPSASVALSGGDRIVYTARLTCDPVDLAPNDTVTDDIDGTDWRVMWAQQNGAFGIDHTVADLRLVLGAT